MRNRIARFTLTVGKWIGIGASALLGIGMLAVLVIWALYAGWRGDALESLATSSRVAETAAGPIEYVLEGDDGPLLLFVHGRPGGYDSAPEAQPGRRVLTPSRPGYLRTPLTVGRTPDEQADAYAALLDALAIDEPVTVMGASGGGPSAIAFAARHPERTAALLLVEPLSEAKIEGARPAFLRQDFTVWLMFSAVERLRGAEGLVSLVIPDPANQRRVLNDPEKAARFTALVWKMWPVSQRNAGWDNDTEQFANLALPAAHVKAPTLIVHGTADTNAPFEVSRRLADRIPNARLVAIEGADHMMPFTHEEEVRAAIDTFGSN